MVLFLARMRELAGGKPVGMKMCVSSPREVLAMCKAMRAEGVAPDFIVVDEQRAEPARHHCSSRTAWERP